MKIKACVMSVAHPKRLLWLNESIKHIESQKFPFHKKVVIIDQFDGWKVPEFLLNKLRDWNWDVKLVALKSRTKAMDLFFEDDETDIIFYNEEDVMATLPSYELVEKIFNKERNGRVCGMLSMTLGGTKFDAPSNFIGDLEFIEKNTIFEDDQRIVFERDEFFKNDWFFEFPGLFVREDIFKTCHHFGHLENKGIQVEMALTNAYIRTNLISKYYKCSLCKKEAPQILKQNPERVNSHCRFLQNLDPQQGSSPVGGNHTYVVQDLIVNGYNGIIVIKSTVEPGTTEKLRKRWSYEKICFVPEFLRERCATTDFLENHDVCIIGVPKNVSTENLDTYMYNTIKKAHGNIPKKFVQVGTTEAELAKYFNNVHNAANIILANSFYEVCQKLNADYSEMKNAIVNRNHIVDIYLDVNDMFRGYTGMCVPGDTMVISDRGKMRIDELMNITDFDNIKILSTNAEINKTEYKHLANVTKSTETKRQLYKFTLEDGRTFICTGEHLQPIVGRNGKPDIVQAYMLTDGCSFFVISYM